MNYNVAFNMIRRVQAECTKGLIADPASEARLTYKKITEQFQPVMRHFFTERHKTPISWFAKRLNYTRSVATTSIVGHILGLGDRHMSNILLDNGSGQVVHIDLGIAFDQVSTISGFVNKSLI